MSAKQDKLGKKQRRRSFQINSFLQLIVKANNKLGVNNWIGLGTLLLTAIAVLLAYWTFKLTVNQVSPNSNFLTETAELQKDYKAASVHFNSCKFSTALPMLKNISKRAAELGDYNILVSSLLDTNKSLVNLNAFEESKYSFREAKSTIKLVNSNAIEERFLVSEAANAYDLSRYKESIKLSKRALKKVKSPQNRIGLYMLIAQANYILGHDRKKWNQNVIAVEALISNNNGISNRTKTYVLRKKSWLNSDDKKVALKQAMSAVLLSEQLPCAIEELYSRSVLGNAYSKNGDFLKAKTELERSIRIAKSNNYPYAGILGSLGEVSLAMGNLSDAETYFLDAISNSDPARVHNTAWYHNQLARVYQKTFEWTRCFQYAEKAASFYNKLEGQEASAANNWFIAGKCTYSQADYTSSEIFFGKAKKIYTALDIDDASLWTEQERLFAQVNIDAKSTEPLIRKLESKILNASLSRQYDHYRLLSNSLREQEKYEASIVEDLKGLKLAEGKDDKWQVWAFSIGIGLSYYNQSNYEEAVPYFLTATNEALNFNKDDRKGSADYWLAKTYANLGEWEKSLSHSRQAAKIYEHRKHMIWQSEMTLDAARAIQILGRVEKNCDTARKALNITQALENERDRYEAAMLVVYCEFSKEDYNTALHNIRELQENISLNAVGQWLLSIAIAEIYHSVGDTSSAFDLVTKLTNERIPANLPKENLFMAYFLEYRIHQERNEYEDMSRASKALCKLANEINTETFIFDALCEFSKITPENIEEVDKSLSTLIDSIDTKKMLHSERDLYDVLVAITKYDNDPHGAIKQLREMSARNALNGQVRGQRIAEELRAGFEESIENIMVRP